MPWRKKSVMPYWKNQPPRHRGHDDQAYHMGHREEGRVWPPERQDNSLLAREGWYQRPKTLHPITLSLFIPPESSLASTFSLPI
ncbi:hypothetical protein TNIN_201891 [Trichonephila inaurata madagascariensis]|uniref:Uncharacterized protein n=1 Tax=Trichonephila inaurata madagascariensis TaxID=2747483 RepID=A0A8X6WV18_9ARAC|nr:hypothetical protein TNIN_201891 [Trichonephila inaurata madagascariensis]